MTTEKEFLEQCRITQMGPGRYVAPQRETGMPGYWYYEFLVKAGNFEYRFPIAVEENLPPGEREAEARNRFKSTAAWLAVAISEW